MTSIYNGYTQQELDDQYNHQSVPNIDAYIESDRRDSQLSRKSLKHYDARYGPKPEMTLDIFPAAINDASVVVYYHGGAWCLLSKDDASFQGKEIVSRNATFVSVNFGLVPNVELSEQAAQARAALAWVHQNIEKHGGNPEQIYVAGHSSGAHLAAMMLSHDFGFEINGGILLSGIYDLEPIRLSYRNAYLKLTKNTAHTLSPIQHIRSSTSQLIIAYGEKETDEFKRQSMSFASEWKKMGNICKSYMLPNLNHFDVGREFINPNSPPIADFLSMILQGAAPLRKKAHS